MKLMKLGNKAQVGVQQLPGFFQIMMLVVIFAGLTFIVIEKFMTASYDITTTNVLNESVTPTDAGTDLASATYRGATCNVVLAVNATSYAVVGSGNYSITDCTLSNSTQDCSTACGITWKVTYAYTWDSDTQASLAVNDTANSLYDYGVGFLGIVILVVMVYLIISIVSGRRPGAR